MKRLIKNFILLMPFIILFSHCTQLERSKDNALIKDVVLRYNKGLVDAAKTGKIEHLRGIVSEDVLRRLYFWIAAWSDSDLYLNAELKGVKFKSVDISESSGALAAKVLTSEDWIYEYRNSKTNQAALPATGIYYEMEYILQQTDNKWIIKEINIKAEKKIQNAK